VGNTIVKNKKTKKRVGQKRTTVHEKKTLERGTVKYLEMEQGGQVRGDCPLKEEKMKTLDHREVTCV